MMKTLVLIIISVLSVLDGAPWEEELDTTATQEEETVGKKMKPTSEDETTEEKIRRINEKAEKMVNKINNSGTTWLAGKADFLSTYDGSPIISHYFEEPLSFGHLGNMLYAFDGLNKLLYQGKCKIVSWLNYGRNTPVVYNNYGLPDHFDARDEWPECPSIRHIYDQGACNSCGVVSVVSAFTDRICIKTEGKVRSFRSAHQVMTCCPDCAKGCDDSKPGPTWQYLKDYGVVTGGDYNSKKGCQPYQVQKCSHNLLDDTPLPPCLELDKRTSALCERKCSNPNYRRKYKKDRKKVAEIREHLTEEEALNEIYYNGPIVATFWVHEDFINYKSGVYQYVTGRYFGEHTVRVLGWGVEDGTPYWLAANSWNEFWGDRGTFKIIRGLNTRGNVMFETAFAAGTYNV